MPCRLDAPDVGKHLKDHLQVGLVFPAPGAGISMSQMGMSMGPDALRAPAGPLPADPADDADMPEELRALKAEAERRLTEWATTGRGLASSSLYDALRLVLHRPRRPPHPRRPARVLRVRLQPRHMARLPTGRPRASYFDDADAAAVP